MPAAACLALPVFYLISLSLLVGCCRSSGSRSDALLASRGYSPERRVPNPRSMRRRYSPRRDRPPGRGRRRIAPLVGVGVAVAAFLVYWLTNRSFEAGRGDFFYLADAFLHGQVWIDRRPAPYDVIYGADRPRLRPVRAVPGDRPDAAGRVVGAETADTWESGINAGLAAIGLLLAWWVTGRIGVRPAARPVRARAAAGLRDADVVGHDPRRRVAHRPPHRDHPRDAHARRAVRQAAGDPPRAPRRGVVPHPGAGRVRGPGDRAVVLAARRRPKAGAGCARIPWRQWALLLVGFLPGLAVFFALQLRPVRVAARVRLRAGDAARLAREPPPAGPVLAGPHPDEPQLPVRPPADPGRARSRTSGRTAWG